MLPPLPPGIDEETVRCELFRIGARLRLGVVGKGLELEHCGILLLHGAQSVPPGFEVIYRAEFPATTLRLAVLGTRHE